MPEISVSELLLVVATAVLAVLPFWIIIRRTGLPGPLSLLLLVPVLNLVILYYIAFAKWPALQGKQKGLSPHDPIHPS